MKNYLFSQGGSGTEYTLMNFDWSEGLYSRHQRIVNFRNESDTFVYIFNNPIDILKSFERRGFLDIKSAVINLQGDVSFKPPMDLKSISEMNVDFFHFEQHFDNFYRQKNKGLFIKFEALDKGWDEIEKFTNLKRKSDFVWKDKVSDSKEYSTEIVDKLNLMYSSWIEKYNKLDSIFYNH
jgi:hypothetical protein